MNPYGLPSKDERPHAAKTKPNRNESARAEWGRAREFCYVCGRGDDGLYHYLTTHEIIGGHGGRSFDPCNLLRAGMHPCHDLLTGLDVPDPFHKFNVLDRAAGITRLLPKLPLAVQLTIKMIRDPEEYDAERLTVLHGRNLPEPAPIPEVFRILFTQHREGR